MQWSIYLLLNHVKYLVEFAGCRSHKSVSQFSGAMMLQSLRMPDLHLSKSDKFKNKEVT